MPLILGANTLSAGGYEVDNSLRFNDGSSDYLSRTQGTGNRKTWTYSVWIKRSQLGTNQNWGITQEDAANNNAMPCSFNTFDKIDWYDYNAPSVSGQLSTNRVFRDTSAWYHIVLAVDTTNATADDRMKMYVNGVQETSFATRVNPSLNYDFNINVNTKLCAIGAYYTSSPATFYDGYMSEINFIDGQQLAPSDFGEFDEDSGIWKPIAYEGTYGTNGFYLEFKDSSALGDDTSGTGNDFTVNNLTSIDQTTDTPTNNFATFNSLDNTLSQYTFSDGNLTGVYSGTNGQGVGTTSTLGVSSGKWYWEFKYTSANDTPLRIGITDRVAISTATTYRCGFGLYDWVYNQSDGTYYNNDVGTAYGDTFTTGDIIGVALDLDNNKLYFSKDGVFQNSGDPTSGATGTGAISITDPSSTNNGFYFAVVGMNSGSGTFTGSYNFGNPPFAITTGNEDANGYGNFEYEVPDGYFALCTKNLAEYG
jgi:hypothetical protein